MPETLPEPSDSEIPEPSEFGKGVVVCLAKFSEHLHQHGPYSEHAIRQYAEWTPAEQLRREAEARRYPVGDSARKLSEMAALSYGGASKDENVSRYISMWMNAASDHFYDLDRDKAPAVLAELADLALRIGHGFTDETWTVQTIDRIRELWRESCLAVDQLLGVEPEWGSW